MTSGFRIFLLLATDQSDRNTRLIKHNLEQVYIYEPRFELNLLLLNLRSMSASLYYGDFKEQNIFLPTLSMPGKA